MNYNDILKNLEYIFSDEYLKFNKTLNKKL